MSRPLHPPFPPAMCYVFGKHQWKQVLRADWVKSKDGWAINDRMAWRVGERCPLCGKAKERTILGPTFF